MACRACLPEASCLLSRAFCVAPCRDKQLDGDIEMLSTTSRDNLVQETHGDDANAFIFWRISPVDRKIHVKHRWLFCVNHFSDYVLITDADLWRSEIVPEHFRWNLNCKHMQICFLLEVTWVQEVTERKRKIHDKQKTFYLAPWLLTIFTANLWNQKILLIIQQLD